MDWQLLSKESVQAISEAIGYRGAKHKTSELYQALEILANDLEDKVKFVLMHWGWNGTVNEAIVIWSFLPIRVG